MRIKTENALAALVEKYGEPLNQKEVAAFFRVNRKTVARHPEAFGGIKIGTIYRFFEKKVAETIDQGSFNPPKVLHSQPKPQTQRKHRKTKS